MPLGSGRGGARSPGPAARAARRPRWATGTGGARRSRRRARAAPGPRRDRGRRSRLHRCLEPAPAQENHAEHGGDRDQPLDYEAARRGAYEDDVLARERSSGRRATRDRHHERRRFRRRSASANHAERLLPRPPTASTATAQPARPAGTASRSPSVACAASTCRDEAPRVRASPISRRRRSYQSTPSKPTFASAQARRPIAATASSVSACERARRYSVQNRGKRGLDPSLERARTRIADVERRTVVQEPAELARVRPGRLHEVPVLVGEREWPRRREQVRVPVRRDERLRVHPRQIQILRHPDLRGVERRVAEPERRPWVLDGEQPDDLDRQWQLLAKRSRWTATSSRSGAKTARSPTRSRRSRAVEVESATSTSGTSFVVERPRARFPKTGAAIGAPTRTRDTPGRRPATSSRCGRTPLCTRIVR